MTSPSQNHASKTYPQPGHKPDYKSDASRVADVLLNGGLAIIPTEQGYGLLASDPSAISRSVATKRRKPGHPLGIIGNLALSEQLHVMPPDHREMLRVWVQELGESHLFSPSIKHLDLSPHGHGGPPLVV